MPALSVRPCTHPGCATLVARGGRCDRHAYAQAPKTVNPKYVRRPWRELRAAHLREHPLCVACFALGVVTPAGCVDHVNGDPEDDRPTNLQSLCTPCHSRKTASQDGGFGNAKGKAPVVIGRDGWPVARDEDGLTLTPPAPRAPGFA